MFYWIDCRPVTCASLEDFKEIFFTVNANNPGCYELSIDRDRAWIHVVCCCKIHIELINSFF